MKDVIKLTVSNERILESELKEVFSQIKKERGDLRVLINYSNISYGKPEEGERKFNGEFVIKITIEPSYNNSMESSRRKYFIDNIISIFTRYNEDLSTRVIGDWGIRNFGVAISFDRLIHKGLPTKSKFKAIKRIIDKLLKDEKVETFKKEINTIIEYK